MNRTTKTRALPLLLATALLAASSQAQGRVGSIYDPDRGPVGLASNKTARRAGDLITVIIRETQDITNDERSNLQKVSDLNYQLLNFNVNPSTFSTLPGIESETQNNFQGTARYEKRGQFTARLTAIVMDVLPGGNLVVQGRREIRIDEERKVIEFSGIVRRYDVKADNTVESELVADATVTYAGTGPLTRATNRTGLGSWLRNAFDWIWPF